MSWERLVEFSRTLAGSAMPRFTELQRDLSHTAAEIVRNEDYFGLTVNQLNLAKGREWWTEYAPLVYASVDFLYGRARVSVPKLIGPTALKAGLPAGMQELPQGFSVRNIRMVGPYPYRGQQVGVTILLFKVRTSDYAQRVLQVAESLSEAIGLTEVAAVAKIGTSVVKSLETLFGMEETIPVLGHRVELKASPVDGFRQHSSALIRSDRVVGDELDIAEGQLRTKAGRPYLESDFVVYSVWGAGAREDETSLAFYPQVQRMYDAAAAGDATSWERAKSLLIAVYQEMLGSNDLTTAEADRLFDEYKGEMIRRRKKQQDAPAMGAKVEAGTKKYQRDFEIETLNARTKDVLAL